MAARAPHRIEITAKTVMNGATHTDASGNNPRQNRIMPKVPILSRTPTSSVAVPGVDWAAVSGSQVCSGTMGALMMKATRKPSISQRPRSPSMRSAARSPMR